MAIYSNEDGVLSDIASASGGSISGGLDDHIKILFISDNSVGNISGNIVGTVMNQYYSSNATITLAHSMYNAKAIIFAYPTYNCNVYEQMESGTGEWKITSVSNAPGDLGIGTTTEVETFKFQVFHPSFLSEIVSRESSSSIDMSTKRPIKIYYAGQQTIFLFNSYTSFITKSTMYLPGELVYGATNQWRASYRAPIIIFGIY